MSTPTSPQELRLAFLSYVEAQGAGSGRGALLVTDEATRPVEFRCTTSIQPNTLQRVLYGDTLRSYIAADLVGKPLLDAIQEKPSVILVREPLFLSLQGKIDGRMVCLRRQGEQLSTALGNGSSHMTGEPSLLTCASGRFQPLTVVSAPGRTADLDAALEMLRPIFSMADLLEPFERIEKVVAELNRQEDRGGDKPRPVGKA
jgi:hypothetical protein